ncbi:MAG: spiro-SPASM protein [Spirochaetes bacterium]|nr:spiro-SPASM protein [Spirochaetota bacterium]MBU0957060.1 spiro-SPASM protein [Spirochaetota bacterium]
MATLAVINACKLSSHALQTCFNGRSALQRVCDFAQNLCGTGKILVLSEAELPVPAGICLQLVQDPTMAAILQACADFAQPQVGTDALVYLQADAPFYDQVLCDSLLELHHKYRSEYTFADGYPPGYAPELLHPRILTSLVQLAGRNNIASDRDGLFTVLQKDINSYDIETILAPRDLRSYRFSPVCDSRRNLQAALSLWKLNKISAQDCVDWLPEHPELLRTLPAFLWVQITEACAQNCSYCPYPQMVGDPRLLSASMPLDQFGRLMDEAASACDELAVDVSLWGEPSLHPDFAGIAGRVLQHPHVTLLIETSGLGWDLDLVRSLMNKWSKRIHWIVSLDSSDEGMYQKLRGDGLAEARDFAEYMSRSWPEQTHIQAVRMQDNEENLENFYRGWTKTTEKVIIQKYDSFAGSLPDRQVADLSPLERMPCRHLARDMAVLLDGTVPLCKHALQRQNGKLVYPERLANVFIEGFSASWQRLEAAWQAHCTRAYPEICEKCDEYHTFNA